MEYSAISTNRMSYDTDGSVVYYKTAANNYQWDIGVATKLNNTLTAELNNEDTIIVITSPQAGDIKAYINLWIFFPEKRSVTAAYMGGFASATHPDIGTFILKSFEGSNNTTDGMNGTWETITFPSGTPAIHKPISSSWRSSIKDTSQSTPYRAIRAVFANEYISPYGYYTGCRLATIHLYGSKGITETLDDLVFCETDGMEITAVNDFGVRPEASTAYDSFKIKNVSPDKTAMTVNVNVTHTDFLLSLSETGPWTASVDFASIAPDALTETIYIKNELGQPPLTLGPKAAKVVATVGSWT